MTYTVTPQPKSLVEIRVTVEASELKPAMEKAAADLSQRVKIEGFRPGKASYDMIVKRFGEMAVLEEALPSIVQKRLVEIVKKESLETVGEPSISVEKAAPGNEVIFSARIAVLPKIAKLADLSKIKVEAKEARIEDKEVERVVDELRKMQSSEHKVEREVVASDKVTVDMDMSVDKVAIEGGAARNHAIYLNEPYYVPGLGEKLVGMKIGEERVFTLKFPDDHFNKMLAGKDVEFKVTLRGVEEIRHPAADDAFAKSVGQESMDKLRELLRKNLEEEANSKEKQRQEIAAIEEILKQSDVGEVPDLLVQNEAHKMMHELEHSIGRQGGTFDDYLKQIKKTRDQILLDFTPEAMKRVKVTVLIREIGKREGLEATDAEVLDEQMKMLNQYKDDGATQERIRSEEGEEYIRTVLRNRKVLAFIREKTVKA